MDVLIPVLISLASDPTTWAALAVLVIYLVRMIDRRSGEELDAWLTDTVPDLYEVVQQEARKFPETAGAKLPRFLALLAEAATRDPRARGDIAAVLSRGERMARAHHERTRR